MGECKHLNQTRKEGTCNAICDACNEEIKHPHIIAFGIYKSESGKCHNCNKKIKDGDEFEFVNFGPPTKNDLALLKYDLDLIKEHLGIKEDVATIKEKP